jgi:16S rRNA (uracil1498-N3)-methyltransferase
MRLTRLYVDQPLAASQCIELNKEASHYLAKVLRLPEGQEVAVFNGTGIDFMGSIELAGKTLHVRLHTAMPIDTESPLKIGLAQGISRGERMDYTLQKATELGIHVIQPLFTERCGVKLSGERLAQRVEHWQKVVISACEQSGRAVVPQILPPIELRAWLSQSQPPQGFVLHHRDSQKLSHHRRPDGVYYLTIGPEGGLSDAEIALLKKHGFAGLKMGPRILRTETAALAALSMMQSHWGDF